MTNTRFNLLDEPWLPCLLVEGVTRDFGIRAALEHAHQIREIADPSPLVTASLHRLLLAIIHRVADGPKNTAAWGRLQQQGSWDMSVFDPYFAHWSRRFDLFDPEYPFYQWPGLDFAAMVPIAKLTHELASGNNATLFDHTTEDAGSSLRPGEAARYLVAQQNYAVGGLVSFAKGEDPARYKSAFGAPLVRGAVVLVKGENLFHTLLRNLCRYDINNDKPFAVDEDYGDQPAWERTPPVEIEARRPYGYLDLLTWQSRRIRLYPELSPDGIAIRYAVIMKGNQFSPGFLRNKAETMQAFRALDKPAAGQDPWQPIGFREDRVLWRDSLSFLQSLSGKIERPGILSWLDTLAENGVIGRGDRVPIDLYGMSTDKAKVLFWRQERLILPLAYLQDNNRELRATLAAEIDKTEKVGQALQAATRELAKLLLAPEADVGGRTPAGEDQGKLAERLSEGRTYWSRLGVPFSTLLGALPDAEARKAEGETSPAVVRWRLELEQAVRTAFRTMTGGLDNSARNLKAVAGSERIFNWRLNEALGG
jgi:CRISPR system Cascade subunit CasA